MAKTLTGYRAPPTGRHTHGAVPANSTHDEMSSNAGHAPHCREDRRPPGRSPTAWSCKPAARSRREQHTASGRNAVMVRECATA